MKILITGITGYIGSHVAKKCMDEGHAVSGIVREGSDCAKYGLDRNSIRLGVYDGTVWSLADFMEEARPDVIVHCAALFIAEHRTGQVDALLQSNVIFSAHIFEAMAVCGVRRIIYTTSSWEHYQNEEYNPVCLYAATKKAASDILRYYVEAEGFRAVILTIYDTYGGEDKRGKLLSLFHKIARTGEELYMSGGRQQMNLVHIRDVEAAYLEALSLLQQEKGEADSFRVYQVRSDVSLTLREIADLYEKVNRVKLPIRWGLRAYRKREVMEAYPYGEMLPGWRAAVTLEEGMAEEGRRNGRTDYEGA